MNTQLFSYSYPNPRPPIPDPPSYPDPVRFVEEVLGEKPYDKQVEILRAVASSRRVSVVGCNGSGKDWAAARAVLWWLHSRSPAKVIVTGPTMRQVDDILWNEIRYAYSRAKDTLGGRMFQTPRYELDEHSFAIGFVTNSPYNIQGFHSPNLLVVITEAHAMEQDDMDAIRRLNPACLLMVGNAFANAGVFYDSHHTRRNLYTTIQISAFDTPNLKIGVGDQGSGIREESSLIPDPQPLTPNPQSPVPIPGMITRQDIEDRKEEWGEDSPMYIGAVLGQFPEHLDGIVVPLLAATQAVRRGLTPEGPIVVACDVARFGHDKTVVVRRQGPVARIVFRARGIDTMKTAAFLKAYCDENNVDTLVVDDTGIGGGVVDRLRQSRLRHTHLEPFIAAHVADSKDYFVNRITEAWWLMGNAYKYGALDTDDDPALIGQVSSRRYEYDKEDNRIRLQSKETMRRSPDEADALAMTFAVPSRQPVKIWT